MVFYNNPRDLTVPTYDLEEKYACRAGGFIWEIHIHPEAVPIFVPAAVRLKELMPEESSLHSGNQNPIYYLYMRHQYRLFIFQF